MVLRALAISIAVAASGCGESSGSSPDAGPRADADPADTFVVEFSTTAGDFTVEVTRSWSPNGADRFRELIEEQFYDDCRFFRVVPGFVVQFGINGDPAVQDMWTDARIPDDPVVESNVRGRVTFAKTSAPDSRTTQLFINYGDNSFLDAMGFSPFGEVTAGLDSVDAINSEYGESPNQSQIVSDGNTYLDASFPNLDSIITARIAP